MGYYVTPENFEKAESVGISRRLVIDRVYRKGWSVNRAITQPPQKQRPRKSWKHLYPLLKENGISVSTFYTRVNVLGVPPDVAATVPPIPPKLRKEGLR